MILFDVARMVPTERQINPPASTTYQTQFLQKRTSELSRFLKTTGGAYSSFQISENKENHSI